MAKFVLNIYDKKEIAKVYECNDYDMLYGTLEDLLQLDDSKGEEGSFSKQIRIFKPFLKEIFEGITDEELRNVKMKDMNKIMQQAIAFAVTEIGENSNEKNAVRTGKK